MFERHRGNITSFDKIQRKDITPRGRLDNLHQKVSINKNQAKVPIKTSLKLSNLRAPRKIELSHKIRIFRQPRHPIILTKNAKDRVRRLQKTNQNKSENYITKKNKKGRMEQPPKSEARTLGTQVNEETEIVRRQY
jgi:hypothetical protein